MVHRNHAFHHIGVTTRHTSEAVTQTMQTLITFLQQQQCHVMVDSITAQQLQDDALTVHDSDTLAEHCDLMIAVGGDGSLLNAGRMALAHNVPLLGINRGRLGFLTDIHPEVLTTKVGSVLAGQFHEERRFTLEATLEHQHHTLITSAAINEVVLMPGTIPNMVEFTIHIDNTFVCQQRGDGLIIATPTGSTAYALSGGGPIIHPQLDAIVIVPMFPHTLTSRPLVIGAHQSITISITQNNTTAPNINWDGAPPTPLPLEAQCHIKKHHQSLRLIHPLDYDYYETLRSKLYWEKQLAG
ncbi:MAG: NAD(+) kinase [Gammaproteobacteria bacterium]